MILPILVALRVQSSLGDCVRLESLSAVLISRENLDLGLIRDIEVFEQSEAARESFESFSQELRLPRASITGLLLKCFHARNVRSQTDGKQRLNLRKTCSNYFPLQRRT
jgi:hypothetical protein